MGNISTAFTFLADTSGAVTAMRDYVTPTIHVLAAIASLACVFFIMNAGYLYMTSTGQPEKMEHAKEVLKKAALGLVIVLAAATLTSLLTNAYGSQQAISNATLPNMQAIPPVENGLVDIIIKAVTGFLNNIIQTIATPFLAALDFFTKATPLMAQNPSVFNLWLAVVGIADALFVVIIALLGFHIMSAATFGFDEIEIKHLLPRIALIFLFMNTSIFLIDAIIGLSNVLIATITTVSGASSVWDTLTQVVKKSSGQGAAALLIMMSFLILSIILLVYYVGRLITLFIGAVLSPLVALIWLVPGFRDFAETAAKTYITTIFVLFVHVVILQLAASLLTGMSAGTGNDLSASLMAMIVGLATIFALLKTQGVMMQFSYVSMGSRNMRKLGGQFVNGVSYMTGKGGRAAVNSIGNRVDNVQKVRAINRVEAEAARTGKPQSMSYETKSGVNATHIAEPGTKSSAKSKTGTTYEATKGSRSKKSGGKTV
jgi:hypothetical protein